jgi:addiction module RelE/StbE family toxin
MIVEYTKYFEKQFLKSPKKVRTKFKDRLKIFESNPYSSELRNHSLRGKYEGYYSINITGDVRALYKIKDDKIILFSFLGTHSQLYG